MRCVCVCHFWGYYGIHVQMFKYQILCFKPPDIAACHYFCLSAFLTVCHSVCLCLFPFLYLSVYICESLLCEYQLHPQAIKLSWAGIYRIFLHVHHARHIKHGQMHLALHTFH